MADASIIMNAKNNASAVLQQVGKDMKSASDAGGEMGKAISSAGNVVKQALSGDFTGAIKSASSAWKSFCSSLAANPMLAIGTAALTAISGLVQLGKSFREHQAEVRAAAKENDDFLASLDRLRNGTLTTAEAIRGDAAKYVEEGNTKAIENRLSLLRQEADGLVEMAKTCQQELKDVQSQWSSSVWEGAKGMFGAETKEERIESLRAARDEAKQSLEEVMDQIKVLEAAQQSIAENTEKAEKAAADAAKKAADEKAEAEKKAAEEAAEAKKQARDKELKDAQDAYDAEEKTHEKLVERQLALEEKLADKAKQAKIKAAQEAAEAELKATKEAVDAAIEAWQNAGMEGIKIRKQQRQAEREAEKQERQQQRDLERWKNGARDRRALAAHELDEARKAEAKAMQDIADAQKAAAEYQREKDQKELKALEDIKKASEDSAEKMKELREALVG